MSTNCLFRRIRKRENIRELEVNKKHASLECVEGVEHALQVRRVSCKY